ncbi:class I SAM-dependent methyltransferase [Altericroceibacterium spongiae]|uniref:Class I SAM-dependent methyltransferase n=1 Tax=Altericroceibacterium spongiae TaxID=2320269 RepID=A0A420EPQ7_9SPHN|nr:cyclopropane-fatty-acyl-phospholipid synthase family protein [Altericroceibacterium spongiae]RKF22659.1 class I SAM-dependent methyltransferase [Altericroceibacterium spongiae]
MLRTNTPRLPLISGLVHKLVQDGRLTIIDRAGHCHHFGSEDCDDHVTVRLHDKSFPLKLALSPTLALGEAYMDDRITIESGSIRDLLRIATSNLQALDEHPMQVIRFKIATFAPLRGRRNHKARSRRNVAHHYDLSGTLYDLFLDSDRQYSCGYFPQGTESLDEGQAAKKRHLAAKLLLSPDQRLLDIGCGWGGLALELARTHGVSVRGITLSREQLQVARSRAEQEELADQVRFDMLDYRDIDERFDRIVSVGMFEHVGPSHYDMFFSTIARSLAPDGIGVIHSIGRRSPPGSDDPWISKYIFPGGYVPALSEVLGAAERSGLWVTDVEILRLHYADTLLHWYDRFQQNRARACALYDERFCRMWEFYLAACEMAFRQGDLMVFQLQVTRRRDAVPRTRDYMFAAEPRR